mmetsp:Transcript_26171/g.57308  ORF Transcript_26171/g.57308 Transcript_26171/m.57308 type:complete len:321 (-) Transcript_26171:347-1309(-)
MDSCCWFYCTLFVRKLFASRLKLWCQTNVPCVLESDSLIVKHFVDVLIGWSLLGTSALDEIGEGIVLRKDVPIGIESLYQSDISTLADVTFQDVRVFESQFFKSFQRITLATQKGCKLPKDALLLRGCVQSIIDDSPLWIDQGNHSCSCLIGNAFDPVNRFLTGLDKTRDIVRSSGTLCDPQSNAVDTALVEGSVFLQSRDDSSLSVSRITAQYFLTSKRCRTIELHDSTLPCLIRRNQNSIDVDGWIGVDNICFKVLSDLICVRTSWQQNSHCLSRFALLHGVFHGRRDLLDHFLKTEGNVDCRRALCYRRFLLLTCNL